MSRRDAGFSLIEMMVLVVTIPVLTIASYMALNNASVVSQTAGTTLTVTGKMRTTLRRLSDELRVSSRTAEDTNENGILDAGEDRNGNGRLDADWAVSANSVTFNRMVADGTYSLPITYSLVEGNLLRSQWVSVSGQVETAIIARQVGSFSVLDAAGEITIGLSVWVQRRGGKTDSQASSMTVVQRN